MSPLSSDNGCATKSTASLGRSLTQWTSEFLFLPASLVWSSATGKDAGKEWLVFTWASLELRSAEVSTVSLGHWLRSPDSVDPDWRIRDLELLDPNRKPSDLFLLTDPLLLLVVAAFAECRSRLLRSPHTYSIRGLYSSTAHVNDESSLLHWPVPTEREKQALGFALSVHKPIRALRRYFC